MLFSGECNAVFCRGFDCCVVVVSVAHMIHSSYLCTRLGPFTGNVWYTNIFIVIIFRFLPLANITGADDVSDDCLLCSDFRHGRL